MLFDMLNESLDAPRFVIVSLEEHKTSSGVMIAANWLALTKEIVGNNCPLKSMH